MCVFSDKIVRPLEDFRWASVASEIDFINNSAKMNSFGNRWKFESWFRLRDESSSNGHTSPQQRIVYDSQLFLELCRVAFRHDRISECEVCFVQTRIRERCCPSCCRLKNLDSFDETFLTRDRKCLVVPDCSTPLRSNCDPIHDIDWFL